MLKTFFARTFSTVVLMALFCTAIFWKGNVGFTIFALMIAFLCIFTIKEIGSILKSSNIPFYTVLTAVCCTVAALLTLYRGLAVSMLIPALFCVTGWFFLLRSCNNRERLLKLCISCGFFFLICLPICLLISIYGYCTPHGEHTGPMLFFFLVLCTKIGDCGAYVFGTLSSVILKGKNHKVIPSVSPGKSYEGCIGGLICTIILCWLLWPVCGLEVYNR